MDERNGTVGTGERGAVPEGGDAPRLLVEHFFRHEQGRIVAGLTRALGPEHLDLVLDCVQEAGLSALLSWPYDGPPREPAAWLHRVARNKAIDRIRRMRWESGDPDEAERRLRKERPAGSPAEEDLDDHLRLIFTCCHPSLTPDARVALTLKTVCGFGTVEIARAFFVPESTMAQRLVRAKRIIRERNLPYHVPTGDELLRRLDSVHRVLLLLFNEGYSSLGGDLSVRADLMDEGRRLIGFLLNDPRTATPASDALDALFAFQSSRNPARIDGNGAMVPLTEQDRGLWDRDRIDAGLIALARSARGNEETEYHVLAEIASSHALAIRFEDTDWERILAAYERLMRHGVSRARSLARIVAESYVHGPKEALTSLDALPLPQRDDEPHRHDAIRADLLLRAGRAEEARKFYERAATAARNPAERLFLLSRASG